MCVLIFRERLLAVVGSGFLASSVYEGQVPADRCAAVLAVVSIFYPGLGDVGPSKGNYWLGSLLSTASTRSQSSSQLFRGEEITNDG